MKIKLLQAGFTVLLIFIAMGTFAQSSAVDEYIQQKGDSLLKEKKLPGIFVGLIDKDRTRYYNFGYADPVKKLPFNAATLFEAGSITKTFTAYILVSLLKEKGIDEKSSIIKYLPDSVQQNLLLQPISFLNLMNHTSGLPRLPGNMSLAKNPMAPYDVYTSADLFAFLKVVEPEAGGKSSYSNLGMALGGVLAELISGKTFAALLDKYIFLPFKLSSPGNNIANATENKSLGYFEDEPAPYWNMNVMAPAGGLKCSAEEMLRYLQYMANPISPAAKQTIDTLLTPTTRLSPAVEICRAWHTLEQKDKPVIYWHNGGTYGFSTFAAFTRDGKHAVIVVVNKFDSNTVSDGIGIGIMKKMME